MEHLFEPQTEEEDSLYIRWNPERSPYAIELKLEVVPVILAEIKRAGAEQFEIGGILFGSFPSVATTTLRIEHVEFIPRDASDGAIFMLDPGQHEALAETKWKAKRMDREPVGFFRTHLRSGPLRLSLADRGLLTSEFRDGAYIVLLIEAAEPHMAAFFVASGGQVSDEPSFREFRFDERDFKALPEVELEPAPEGSDEQRSRVSMYLRIAALVAIAIVACVFMWRFSKDATSKLFGNANHIKLAAADQNHVLRITWNRNAREVDEATGATLRIQDGGQQRDVALGVDELRLGAVEYQRKTDIIQLTLSLTVPGSQVQPQTIKWSPVPTE